MNQDFSDDNRILCGNCNREMQGREVQNAILQDGLCENCREDADLESDIDDDLDDD